MLLVLLPTIRQAIRAVIAEPSIIVDSPKELDAPSLAPNYLIGYKGCDSGA
jgi:hypothetical protein